MLKKKLILFCVLNVFVAQSQAVNLKKVAFGTSAIIFSTVSVLSTTPLLAVSLFVVMNRNPMGPVFPKELGKNLEKICLELSIIAIASFYLAKKSYEKFSEVPNKPENPGADTATSD